MAEGEQSRISDYPMKDIENPHDHDVLSGRGNFVNYHTGNEHFRNLVKSHKIAYVACPKPQKGKFSRLIVNEIRSMDPPGRFLKQDDKTKLWHDIGDKKALDKTRQALREGAPELLKELSVPEENGAPDPSPVASLASSLTTHAHQGINQAIPQRFNSQQGIEYGSIHQANTETFEPIMLGGRRMASEAQAFLSRSCPPVLPQSTPEIVQSAPQSIGLNSNFRTVALKDPDYDAPKLRTLSSAAAAELVSRIPAHELEPNPINITRGPMRHRPALFGTPRNAAPQVSASQQQNGENTESADKVPSKVTSLDRSDSMTFDDLVSTCREHKEKKDPKSYASSGNMSFSIGDLGNESNLSSLFQDSLVIGETSVLSGSAGTGAPSSTPRSGQPPSRIHAQKRGSVSSEMSIAFLGASQAAMSYVDEDKEI